MPLNTTGQTLICNLDNMERILLIICCVLSFTLQAQHTSREIKKHRQVVSESKTLRTAVTSLDTLFIAGRPYGMVRIFARDSQIITAQSIHSLDSGKTLIEISHLEKINAGPDRFSFFLFSFPALDMMCEVQSRSKGQDIYSTIQQYGLLAPNGLDTVQVETFVVLKGRINMVSVDGARNKQATKHEMIIEKSIIVPRDQNKPLVFTSENIEQGGVVIGSFTEGVAETPNGQVKKISVYNSIGALICTATETTTGSKEWRLLTYRDNKFYSMRSASGNDKEEVALYLIKLGLL
jgi:hypothetical protein